MVARIRYGKQVEGVLFYNKVKTDKGVARALLCHNLPLMPHDGKIDIFALTQAFRMWLGNAKSKLGEPIFHVSLNPNPKDRLDEMRLLEIAHYYMEKMGYGDQPYIVYQHNDIKRSHLHIVSLRIKEDGTPVNDFEYKRHSKAVTEEIERVFDLTPTIAGQQSNTREELHKVEYTQSDLKAQLSSALFNLTNRYRFSSRGEFNTLLKQFNIWMEECKGEVNGHSYTGIIYGALDAQGNKVGKPIKSSRISRDFGYKALQQSYEKTKTWMKKNPQQLENARQVIRQAMKTTDTPETFAAEIHNSGMAVVFHRSTDHNNRIYGVTFIDHRDGFVINGSRLDKSFTANNFEKLFSRKEQSSDTTQRAELSQHPEPKPASLLQELSSWLENAEPSSELWIPGWDLFNDLLDEAIRPDDWEEWTPKPKKKKKRYI